MQIIGYDSSGTPRVFGNGISKAQAERQAIKAATEYLANRPDTGPLAQWSFKIKLGGFAKVQP